MQGLVAIVYQLLLLLSILLSAATSHIQQNKSAIIMMMISNATSSTAKAGHLVGRQSLAHSRAVGCKAMNTQTGGDKCARCHACAGLLTV